LAKYGAAGKTLKLLTKRLEKMQRNEFEGNQKSIKHVLGGSRGSRDIGTRRGTVTQNSSTIGPVKEEELIIL
jgi:hypothetical protein